MCKKKTLAALQTKYYEYLSLSFSSLLLLFFLSLHLNPVSQSEVDFPL